MWDTKGATIWARKTLLSDVFYNKPDKWFKIWFFLIQRVNYNDNKQYEKGECFTTYSEITQYTKATKNEIDHCFRWLKSATMVATQKATRGMYVKVLNYELYQDLDNYKSDTGSETTAKQKRHYKKEGKEQEEVYPLSDGIKFWNDHKNIPTKKPLVECKRITENLRKLWKKRKPTETDWEIAVMNYIAEIKLRRENTGYYAHRWPMAMFLERQRGYNEFVERNDSDSKETKSEIYARLVEQHGQDQADFYFTGTKGGKYYGFSDNELDIERANYKK